MQGHGDIGSQACAFRVIIKSLRCLFANERNHKKLLPSLCKKSLGATFPGRVIVAAVQQNRPGDVGCGEPPRPCSEEPLQPLCARAKQVKVYAMDANEVTSNVES